MSKKRKSDRFLPERVYHKHNAYYYVTRDNKWMRLGKNFVEAMAEWSKIAEPVRQFTTMNDLFDKYMLEVAPLKAKASYKSNCGQVKKLRLAFGCMAPHEVTAVDIYQYLDVRASQNAPVAANREKELLSHVFTYAIRWGVMTTNPCAHVKRLKVEKRDRYIEDWEFEAVRGIASPLLDALMQFAYLTGLRQADILDLNRADLKEDGIYIRTSKTGAKLIIEYSDALNKVIAEAKRLSPFSMLLFGKPRDGQRYSARGISAMWQRLMNKAIETGVIKDRFTFKDIRRKTATDIEKATSRENARKLLGHTTQDMTERYISGYQKVQPIK